MACLLRVSSTLTRFAKPQCGFATRAASTLPGLLAEKNEELPHRTMLHSRHQKEQWTVSDLERHSTALAYGLDDLELVPGDTILAWMSNQAEHVTTIFAAARQGLKVVNAKNFDTENELSVAISKSNCKCVIYSGSSNGDVPGDGHDMLKKTIPQLIHGNPWEFGPKILKSPDYPSLRYVLTTRWDKPDEGMLNFKEIFMYDALKRYTQPDVDANTEMGCALVGPGQLSRSFTQGQLLAAAEKLTQELQVNVDSKICLNDQSFFGVAVGATVALQNTIPLIIPSELGDAEAIKKAKQDEGDFIMLDANYIDSLLL